MLKILDEDNINTYPKILVPRFIRNFKNLRFTFRDIYPNYKFPTAPTPPLSRFHSLWFIIDKKTHKMMKERYEKAKEKYQNDTKEFQELIIKMATPEFTMAERRRRLTLKLEDTKKGILKSSQIMRDEEIKKGPSEDFFYKYVKKHTDYIVYKSLKFGYYYPDLVIIKNNLVIDLEIDEPYTLSTKEPIHYDKVDEGRDNYFLNGEFVVIHFSENQILKDTEFCIEIINTVIDTCTKLIEKEKSVKYQSFETSVWSYEECFNFAYNNTRDQILSKVSILEERFGL